MSAPGAFPTPPSRRASYAPVSHSSPGAGSAALPHSPTDPYANLSSQALSPNAYLSPSPENPETSQLLGRDSMHMPAPSMMSRNSTIPGTPPLGGDNRASWGSGAGLAGAAGGIAGSQVSYRLQRIRIKLILQLPRGRSGLAATPTSRLSVSDADDDEFNQGHIAPSAAVAGGAGAAGLNEKRDYAGEGGGGKSRKKLWIGLGAAALLLLVGLGVGLGVG